MLLKRIYLILLLLGIIFLFILSFISITSFTSHKVPDEVVENYLNYGNFYLIVTILIFFVLLLLANIIYLNSRKLGYLIFSGAFFIVFIDIYFFFMQSVYVNYRIANEPPLKVQNPFATTAGLIFSLLTIVIICLNYFLLKKIVVKKIKEKKIDFVE